MTMTDLTHLAGRVERAQPNRLAQRDLKVGVALGGKYAVTVHNTEGGRWTVSVQFEGKEGVHAIETARGDTKVWANIEPAITYVQENCKDATSVVVKFGKWELVRVNDAAASPSNR
jgi:hypothetical protein